MVCLHWVKYRWNLVIAGQNVLFWRWSIKRLDLQTTYRYRAVIFRIYSYRAGLPSFVDTRSDLMRVSYSGTSNWKFLKFWKYVDLHRSPVERQPKYRLHISWACSPYPYQPRHYMRSWATAVCQIWEKYSGNCWAKCPILKVVHQTVRSPNDL